MPCWECVIQGVAKGNVSPMFLIGGGRGVDERFFGGI